LDAIDRIILRALYIEGLNQSINASRDTMLEPICILSMADSSVVDEHIKRLSDLGMVKDKRLTEFGRSALSVVFAGGVFDIIHPGHIHTLRTAKSLGDVLVVVVARDSTAERLKGKKPLHDENTRLDMVASIKYVDVALLGHENDIFKTVEYVKPDIIALGYDQVHEEGFIMQECRRRGLNVNIVRLTSPLPEIKSSLIKSELKSSIYSI
jgi:cytidyltransferase-like protein